MLGVRTQPHAVARDGRVGGCDARDELLLSPAELRRAEDVGVRADLLDHFHSGVETVPRHGLYDWPDHGFTYVPIHGLNEYTLLPAVKVLVYGE